MDVFDDWQALLAAQDLLTTRQQALARGLTDKTLAAHVEAGRWTALGGGVYATFTGPLTVPALRRRAVLAYWPCALSHRTAAEIHGLLPAAPSGRPTHVVRPYGVSAAGIDGVVVHRSRAFAHIVAPGLDPPVVSAAHTAIDLAVSASDARAAMRTMLRCLTVSSLSPATVRAALEVRRPRRWRTALLDALRYAEEGVTSALETLWVLEVEEPHRLPRAARQVPVVVDGRRLVEDLVYRGTGGEVIVRLDGRRYHAEEAVTVRDRRRANAAELAGRRQLSYGWREVTGAPCAVAREVAQLVGSDVVACERCSPLSPVPALT